MPLSRLNWTVLGAQRTSRRLVEVPVEHRISSFLVSMRRVLWPRIGALRYLEVPTPLSPGVVLAQASHIHRYLPVRVGGVARVNGVAVKRGGS